METLPAWGFLLTSPMPKQWEITKQNAFLGFFLPGTADRPQPNCAQVQDFD